MEGDEEQPISHLYQKAEGIGRKGVCSIHSINRVEQRESNGMRGIGSGSVLKLGGAHC